MSVSKRRAPPKLIQDKPVQKLPPVNHLANVAEDLRRYYTMTNHNPMGYH